MKVKPISATRKYIANNKKTDPRKIIINVGHFKERRILKKIHRKIIEMIAKIPGQIKLNGPKKLGWNTKTMIAKTKKIKLVSRILFGFTESPSYYYV